MTSARVKKLFFFPQASLTSVDLQTQRRPQLHATIWDQNMKADMWEKVAAAAINDYLLKIHPDTFKGKGNFTEKIHGRPVFNASLSFTSVCTMIV